jgi:FKBP-type peptidyl-prolyl cis-trans isomerase FkpA
MKKVFYLLLPIILLSTACESQFDEDKQLMLDYFADNNIDAEVTEEGVYYMIETEGTGDRPLSSSTVTVNYEGSLLDGSIFDSSFERGTPSTFGLWQVIQGWQIGIPLFKEGGEGYLYIPSELAYGGSARSGIPSNSVLIFKIELIDVE